MPSRATLDLHLFRRSEATRQPSARDSSAPPARSRWGGWTSTVAPPGGEPEPELPPQSCAFLRFVVPPTRSGSGEVAPELPQHERERRGAAAPLPRSWYQLRRRGCTSPRVRLVHPPPGPSRPRSRCRRARQKLPPRSCASSTRGRRSSAAPPLHRRPHRWRFARRGAAASSHRLRRPRPRLLRGTSPMTARGE